MAESIGLIERAAALLRQREAAEVGSAAQFVTRAPSSGAAAFAAPEPTELNGAELTLDRGQLASRRITCPRPSARGPRRSSA